MQIYIHRNNEQLGPFTEAEIRAQLAAGTLSLLDNVWWEGQPGWVPLGQSPFAATLSPASPGSASTSPLPGTPAVAPANATAPETSKLAIWALVAGCLSLLCSLFASIPAIILGHMGLSEIKKNPALQGRGMALAGMILGYVFTTLIVVYLIFMSVVFFSMGTQVKDVFKTIDAQLKAAQSANSMDESTNSSGQITPAPTTTNSPDQSTNSAPATTSPDQSTNSAPATTNSPDSSTNSSTPSTNAAPMNQ